MCVRGQRVICARREEKLSMDHDLGERGLRGSPKKMMERERGHEFLLTPQMNGITKYDKVMQISEEEAVQE